jgi:hypothetical protein
MHNNPGPGSPNWGPDVTAEDDPPSPNRCYGGSDWTNLFQYSGTGKPAQTTGIDTMSLVSSFRQMRLW